MLYLGDAKAPGLDLSASLLQFQTLAANGQARNSRDTRSRSATRRIADIAGHDVETSAAIDGRRQARQA
jgi:hypothetical protein